MTIRPDHRADRPNLWPLPDVTAPDALSQVLDTFRVPGATLLRGEYSAPWSWDAPSASAIGRLLRAGSNQLVVLHVIVQGRCWLEVPGAPRLHLAEGDLVGFPQGDAHRMGNGAEVTPFAILPHFPLPPWQTIPTIRMSGDGEVTRILCV